MLILKCSDNIWKKNKRNRTLLYFQGFSGPRKSKESWSPLDLAPIDSPAHQRTSWELQTF